MFYVTVRIVSAVLFVVMCYVMAFAHQQGGQSLADIKALEEYSKPEKQVVHQPYIIPPCDRACKDEFKDGSVNKK